jgi:hypothetical protein
MVYVPHESDVRQALVGVGERILEAALEAIGWE